MKSRIGIFGGTYDPVHTGHLAIAKAFLDSGEIDELWIMPAPDPPHKSQDVILPFEVRYKLLELGFSQWGNVVISDFENNLSVPSYSFRTIQNLKKRYPDKEFYFCIGSDSLENLSTWYRYKDLSKECMFMVAVRPGFNKEKVETDILKRCKLVPHKPVDISSTQIRQFIKEGKDISGLVPDSVKEYIHSNNLYC